ncbi:sensor histidine kinase KdpD [Allocoleopsis franciscana]|uniref:Osmosensitive K+ channel His kinase sensor n=1 Tax=Allocoleopsis franciscana PCC 7113 TaxID=1173027 RepID=K9WPQ8_9CYAN|nr:sensor histidine kinase KdpD [Allocoleopsis franciscana]AFZ21532.1 osmosensitive K+ channel His kinase sensor [Allocoleopsis franciscana PCC 7113]
MIHQNEIANQLNSTEPNDTLSRRRRGKHKMFIGMAPGVGKTYRMLEEAHRLKEEGIDVVIGLLETHGREETADKAVGLEMMPKKLIVHGGVTLGEMDTDAILERQPQLVLVDELAHTNIPGSLREKRYQDVEVILETGIDVYSTVNIQHLESLNDLVAKITGVVVRERIPDRILDEATEVVVVDVTPETLQERLIEGKIYAPEKIEQSLQNFFQKRHLVALRELALREVADNIEESAEKNSTPAAQFCNVHERVLVCISTYPNSAQLLRRGARLATVMRSRLYALFVDHPERFLTRDESLYIETCKNFCLEFGGEFICVKSANVADAIAATARQYHITQVILGQSHKSRWEILWRGSLVQKLVRYLKDVDLHIIATEKKEFKRF